MVGGVGIGAVEDGRAFVGLSTSAQLFVAADAHRPAPAQLVHAFCHAVPGRWCQMAAMLNGAGVLAAVAHLLGDADIPTLLAEAEARFAGPSRLLVLPYLSGERTPHDDPYARGVVFGLTPDTSRAELVLAALEGVAFSFADARDALAAGGTRIASAGIVGGGARSAFWTRLIASVLGVPLRVYAGGARGPAFGAARLARLALGADDPDSGAGRAAGAARDRTRRGAGRCLCAAHRSVPPPLCRAAAGIRAMSAIAVLDIGKTNVKLSVTDADGTVRETLTTPNTVRPGPPYRHHDVIGAGGVDGRGARRPRAPPRDRGDRADRPRLGRRAGR